MLLSSYQVAHDVGVMSTAAAITRTQPHDLIVGKKGGFTGRTLSARRLACSDTRKRTSSLHHSHRLHVRATSAVGHTTSFAKTSPLVNYARGRLTSCVTSGKVTSWSSIAFGRGGRAVVRAAGGNGRPS
eukprot:CAMPEP_0118939322 /NCGR_PEP_ID=MMETSP1169-20130426/28593_1 /TAXON_ID=36882 /ORGANISM="Pyramimonas obovata, Strain CCMP722" /LENGTH=128 /DNA_ID=CAMNT_0006883567 /DNA_START=76 /DNA_END=458 /DNA_ORIENTATION=-